MSAGVEFFGGGRGDLIDRLDRLIAGCPAPPALDIVTGAVSRECAEALAGWLVSGRLSALRLLCDGSGFALQQRKADSRAQLHADIERILGIERVRGIEVHAKAHVLRWPGGVVGELTSGNLNRNPRPEQVEAMPAWVCDAVSAGITAAFAAAPPGLLPADTSAKRAGAAFADALQAAGLRRHRGCEDVRLYGEVDEWFVAQRTSFARWLRAAHHLAGPGESVCSQYSADPLELEVAASVPGLVLTLPSRFARRGRDAASKTVHALAQLGDRLRFSRSHAKVAAFVGPAGGVVVTGTATFTPWKHHAADLMRVRLVDRDEAEALRQEVIALDPEDVGTLPAGFMALELDEDGPALEDDVAEVEPEPETPPAPAVSRPAPGPVVAQAPPREATPVRQPPEGLAEAGRPAQELADDVVRLGLARIRAGLALPVGHPEHIALRSPADALTLAHLAKASAEAQPARPRVNLLDRLTADVLATLGRGNGR